MTENYCTEKTKRSERCASLSLLRLPLLSSITIVVLQRDEQTKREEPK